MDFFQVKKKREINYQIIPETKISEIIKDFEPTKYGINIIGGYCNLKEYGDVIIKKVQNKKILLQCFLVDMLKPLFNIQNIQELGITLKVDKKIEYTRNIGDKKGEIKDGLYLVQKRINGETFGDYTQSHYNHNEYKLWLPEDDKELCKSFLNVYLFRMIVGIKDPGPHNFMIDKEKNIYSIDECSAFSNELSPNNIPKPWLISNLTGTKGLKQLRNYVNDVEEIQKELLLIPNDKLIGIIRKCFPDNIENYLNYITNNIKSLVNDFRKLVGIYEVKIEYGDFTLDDIEEGYYPQSILSHISISLAKSGLQKEIRRNKPIEAIQWCLILLGSFKIENMMNRLMTIASEDISLGNMNLLLQLHKFHKLYIKEREICENDYIMINDKKIKLWRQQLRNSEKIRNELINIIYQMCQSPKTRICDHTSCGIMKKKEKEYTFEEIEKQMIECYKSKLIESEMKLFEMIGSYINVSERQDKMYRMSSIFKKIEEIVESNKKPFIQALYYFFEQRNKSSYNKVKCMTNISHSIFILTRPESDLQYHKYEVPEYDIKKIVNEIIHKEIILDIQPYLIDKHVRGIKNIRQDIFDFFNNEEPAITPKIDIINPYYEICIKYVKNNY
jgi:hypothetical protein